MNESDKLFARAQDQLTVVTRGDLADWKKNPLTLALVLSLRGQVQEVLETWKDGGYTTSSSEGTSQLNAQALATSQALEAVVEWIDSPEIGDIDDNSDGSQSIS